MPLPGIGALRSIKKKMDETPNAENKSLQDRFYSPVSDLKEIDRTTHQILGNYSHIEPDKILPHVVEIRDRAWNIHPYPCIGQFRFLDFSIGAADSYLEILQRVKAGHSLLDLGCCFGQDLRKLVADGAPSEKLYGSDLRQTFWDLGFDLFLDRDKFKATFIEADVFDPDSNLEQLNGAVDVIHSSSFFHLFDLEQQMRVAKRVVKMLKSQKGSMIFGRQMGNIKPGNHKRSSENGGEIYWHDPSTFERFWKDIGHQTGTALTARVEWDLKRSVRFPGTDGWRAMGVRRLRYEVRIE